MPLELSSVREQSIVFYVIRVFCIATQRCMKPCGGGGGIRRGVAESRKGRGCPILGLDLVPKSLIFFP